MDMEFKDKFFAAAVDNAVLCGMNEGVIDGDTEKMRQFADIVIREHSASMLKAFGNSPTIAALLGKYGIGFTPDGQAFDRRAFDRAQQAAKQAAFDEWQASGAAKNGHAEGVEGVVSKMRSERDAAIDAASAPDSGYRYAINNDLNRPIVGLPMTCACGRLMDELDANERLSVDDKLHCWECLPEHISAKMKAGGGHFGDPDPYSGRTIGMTESGPAVMVQLAYPLEPRHFAEPQMKQALKEAQAHNADAIAAAVQTSVELAVNHERAKGNADRKERDRMAICLSVVKQYCEAGGPGENLLVSALCAEAMRDSGDREATFSAELMTIAIATAVARLKGSLAHLRTISAASGDFWSGFSKAIETLETDLTDIKNSEPNCCTKP